MKPTEKNPFAEIIERGRLERAEEARMKAIRHKKFLECFPCVTDKRNREHNRHPNPEML